MEIRDLYAEFFDDKKRYNAYASEKEYWDELFSCLDMILYVAVMMKVQIQKGNQEQCLNQWHLHGSKLSVEDMLREVSKGRKFPEEPFLIQQVRDAFASAKLHIRNRLQYSKQSQEFRWQFLTSQTDFLGYQELALLLVFSVSYDTMYETIYCYLQDENGAKHPTLQLVASLYQLVAPVSGEEVAKTIQQRGHAFRFFLELHPLDKKNVMTSMLCMPERVIAFLYGSDEMDNDLKLVAWEYDYSSGCDPILIRQHKMEQILSYAVKFATTQGSHGNVIQIYGAEGIGKHYLVKCVARECNSNVLFVDTAKVLIGNVTEVGILLKKIVLEALLLRAAICFENYEPTQLENEQGIQKCTPSGLRFLLDTIREDLCFAFWLSKEKTDFLLEYKLHLIYVEIPFLEAKEREVLWREYTKEYKLKKDVDLQLCANQYVLTPRGIQEVLRTASLLCGDDEVEITKDHIREAVGQQMINQLGKLATPIKSVYQWNDLVIDDEQRRKMEMICNHVKYRSVVGESWGFYEKTAYGRGVCALFYGAPGTGKTMAVQVIANELGLDLYRIDLSQMVSKYIGETEKNISDLFQRAKHTNALLFFDEADALFSKRSEVKDHHDKSSNAQTAHLLQKLEDYEGIVILATNYVNNIDEAFKRRIKFMIQFVFPTAKIRLQLWNTILPPKVPKDEELDFAFFSEKFELSGSSIKEILTNAAYIAAAQKRGIKNSDIVEAIKLNFSKYGKILGNDDFEYLG